VKRTLVPARRRLPALVLLLGLFVGVLLLVACESAPTTSDDPTPTSGAAGPVSTLAPAAPDGLLADLSRAIKTAFDR